MIPPEFLIPPDSSTWIERMIAGVHAAEEVIGRPLRRTFGGTKSNVTKRDVPDLAKYFKTKSKTKSRTIELFYNRCVDPTQRPHVHEYYNYAGQMDYTALVYRCSLHYPGAAFKAAESFLVRVGDALQAHSGQYCPRDSWVRYSQAHWCSGLEDNLYIRPPADRTAAESKLPLIYDAAYGGHEHELQPRYIGWLNYWSADVCSYLNFPGALKGSPILDRCYQTPRGAWLIKIADEPLRVRNDDDAELLLELYERFPRVGVRKSRDEIREWLPPLPS
ncbi:MAG TPA: DUF5953 family protein [Steroidobacteraceae bacterium]|nr:DUF5953 family protein [Steroidobacteraceae bacterium]